ncbi:AsnC family protein [Amycolatopsis cynarae]|uniref:AsnC family protein n=2 Tax=Amycolatopsis TaxID=1813 RepID=A0ABY7AV75_9PSEU|nr:AsnC family protein [Amycolatopsis sp. HUAS 11-8]WAL63642.1 AsnC family protein [Amycolatopsis sp. HUAS 11-8]
MAVTDPVDARLLAALADLGKAAVHELAARVGMDPREVAYRLVALSGSGLPLLVGVESDPNGLRAALAGGWSRPGQPPPPAPAPTPPPTPAPGPGVAGVPSGAYGVPSGVYGVPSGRYPAHGAGQPVQGVPSGRYPAPLPARPPAPQAPPAVQRPQPPAPLDPVISTWGPPQTASWARGDQRAAPSGPVRRTGRIGEALNTQGLEGEQLSVQLLEVQDPADFLFAAAGYRLEEGERAIVVHTEITNRGAIPFVSLPDNYLELLTAEGRAITKAPVSLTSRPPHKIGVQPGETAGGHTVYVVPEATRVVSLRWSPRPEPDERTLTWSLDD